MDFGRDAGICKTKNHITVKVTRIIHWMSIYIYIYIDTHTYKLQIGEL
jgi:hypothetical protein